MPIQQFDLRTEPWIRASRPDGSITEIGLEEALVNAHLYKTYKAPTGVHYDTYVLYRFLTTIMLDVFRPKSYKSIARLFEQGSFDGEKIREYLDQYVWDLYDAEHPFMQYPGEIKGEPHPVASLSPLYQTGNNDLFHMRTPRINSTGEITNTVTIKNKLYKNEEWWNPFTPAEAAFTLLRVQCVYGKYGGTQTAASPIANASLFPLMALAFGKNSFETIMFAATPVTEPEKGTVLWAKDHYEFMTGDPIDNFLDTAFVPCIYIRFGQIEEDGRIYSVFYNPIKPENRTSDKNKKKKAEESETQTMPAEQPKNLIDDIFKKGGRRELIREKEPHIMQVTLDEKTFYIWTDISDKPWLRSLENIREMGKITSYLTREKNILEAINTRAGNDTDDDSCILYHDLFGLTMQGQGTAYTQLRCRVEIRDALIENLWMQKASEDHIARIRKAATVLDELIMDEYYNEKSPGNAKQLGEALSENAVREFYDRVEPMFDAYLKNIQHCTDGNGNTFEDPGDQTFKDWDEKEEQKIYLLCIEIYDRVPIYFRSMLRRISVKQKHIRYNKGGAIWLCQNEKKKAKTR